MTKYEFFDGKNLTGPKKAQSQVHPLPPEEPNFKWRVRVDLRCALDAPLSAPEVMPSCYAEVGWSLYENAEPDEYNKVMSVMCENTRHPHWNQELLLNNPAELLDLSGFLWIVFRDRNNQGGQPFEKITIPLFAFRPFQPVHLEIIRGGKKQPSVRGS